MVFGNLMAGEPSTSAGATGLPRTSTPGLYSTSARGS